MAPFSVDSPKSINSSSIFDVQPKVSSGSNCLLRRMSSFDSKKLLQINMAIADKKKKAVKPLLNLGSTKSKKITKTPTKGPSSIRLIFCYKLSLFCVDEIVSNLSFLFEFVEGT